MCSRAFSALRPLYHSDVAVDEATNADGYVVKRGEVLNVPGTGG